MRKVSDEEIRELALSLCATNTYARKVDLVQSLKGQTARRFAVVTELEESGLLTGQFTGVDDPDSVKTATTPARDGLIEQSILEAIDDGMEPIDAVRIAPGSMKRKMAIYKRLLDEGKIVSDYRSKEQATLDAIRKGPSQDEIGLPTYGTAVDSFLFAIIERPHLVSDANRLRLTIAGIRHFRNRAKAYRPISEANRAIEPPTEEAIV